MYRISPGLADEGFSVIRFSEASAFKPKGSRGILFGLSTSEIACDIML